MEGKRFSQDEWDLLSQQNYDLKREVNRLTVLEKEYLSEMEILQSNDGSGRKNLDGTVQHLEQELRTVKHANNVRIDQLQSDLQSKDEQIKDLMEKLQSTAKDTVTISDCKECERRDEKISDLEMKNSRLIEENKVLEDETQELRKNIEICEEKIMNLMEECQMLTENYSCKKQELVELKSHVEIMQDELFCAKGELDQLKSKPLESLSRGNSLFAEVDEKRVQLQSKMKTMAGHYEEMKRRIVQLEIQMVSLKHENLSLCNKWEKEINERANDVYDIERTYEKRIATLEKLLKDYEKELASRPIVATKALKEDELGFIKYQIKLKNDEIERHLRLVNDYSLSNMMMRDEKIQTERELRLSEVRIIRLQQDLELAEEQLTELKEKLEKKSEEEREVPSEITKAVPNIKSALKNSNMIKVSDIKLEVADVKVVKKEVEKENRNVGFSEDCKKNDGLFSKYRGGKVYSIQVSAKDLKKKEF